MHLSNNNRADLEDYHIYQNSSIRDFWNLYYIITEESTLHPPPLPTALARLQLGTVTLPARHICCQLKCVT